VDDLTTHWLSLTLSLVVFAIVLIVRGPDALALFECAAVLTSLLVGMDVAAKLQAVEIYCDNANAWRRRARELEDAIRDFEQLRVG
jgi:hypothetical protein